MNREKLVAAVARQMDGSRASAQRAVNAVLNGIRDGIKKDKSVLLVGFGTFVVKSRKARKGRNPRTGAPLTIKASRTVGFRPGKALKQML